MKLLITALLISVAYSLRCNTCISSTLTDEANAATVKTFDLKACDASGTSESCSTDEDACFASTLKYTYGEDKTAGTYVSMGCGKKDKSPVNWNCAQLKTSFAPTLQPLMTLGDCADSYCEKDNCNSSSSLLFSFSLLFAAIIYHL